MKTPVYMDYQSTTPPDARAVEAMMPYLFESFGNASSVVNRHGQTAREAVEHARTQVAELAGAEPGEIVFTSGATESINTVIRGIARNRAWTEVSIITCATEHSAVLETCDFVEKQGARVVRMEVNEHGHLSLDKLQHAIASTDAKVKLVSLMHANNEIGVIHPIKEIGRICQREGAHFHVDAAQTYGKLPIKLRDWSIDFLSISGHKIYAPKGIGALIVRRQIPPLRITPLLYGGGQERGWRAGTMNVPGIVALGAAAALASAEMDSEQPRLTDLRNTLLNAIRTALPDVIVNGCMKHRLPGNLNLSFPGIEGQHLLPALQDKLSVSSGSACKSGSNSPSHVLKSLGLPDDLAMASLRFGLGRYTTPEEIEFAAETVTDTIQKLRSN